MSRVCVCLGVCVSRGVCVQEGSPGVCVCPRMCMSRECPGCVCLGGVTTGVYTPRPRARHPPMNRMTDRCKNITFPQVRLRVVIMDFSPNLYKYLLVTLQQKPSRVQKLLPATVWYHPLWTWELGYLPSPRT